VAAVILAAVGLVRVRMVMVLAGVLTVISGLMMLMVLAGVLTLISGLMMLMVLAGVVVTVRTVMMVLAVLLLFVLPQLVGVDGRVTRSGGGDVVLVQVGNCSLCCDHRLATVALGIGEAGHERERRRHSDEDAGVDLHVEIILSCLRVYWGRGYLKGEKRADLREGL
jgi:hypothetical protein